MPTVTEVKDPRFTYCKFAAEKWENAHCLCPKCKAKGHSYCSNCEDCEDYEDPNPVWDCTEFEG